MALGVRADASVAVRAGLQHSLFTVQPEEVALAIDSYLRSLKPILSPHRVKGELSPSAQRGAALFQREDVGCATCHTPGLFTDLKRHNVGTGGRLDREDNRFDTPTLIEVWRSAPYLHNGSAGTIRDVLTTSNPESEHGEVEQLSPRELEDLVAYVLSL